MYLSNFLFIPKIKQTNSNKFKVVKYEECRESKREHKFCTYIFIKEEFRCILLSQLYRKILQIL